MNGRTMVVAMIVMVCVFVFLAWMEGEAAGISRWQLLKRRCRKPYMVARAHCRLFWQLSTIGTLVDAIRIRRNGRLSFVPDLSVMAYLTLEQRRKYKASIDRRRATAAFFRTRERRSA